MRTIRNLVMAAVMVCAALLLSSESAQAQYGVTPCNQVRTMCNMQLGCNNQPFSCWVEGQQGPCMGGQTTMAWACWNPWTNDVSEGYCGTGGTCGGCNPEVPGSCA
jgi:hypothetical protein